MAAHASHANPRLMIHIKTLDVLTKQHITSLGDIALLSEDLRWLMDDLLNLQTPQDVLTVAFVDNVAVGYIVAKTVVDEAEIHTLVVDISQRRKGVGKVLIKSLCSYALEHYIAKIFLEVKPSNATARKLYISQGFENIGVRENYYALKNGQKQDAHLLCKSLPLCS